MGIEITKVLIHVNYFINVNGYYSTELRRANDYFMDIYSGERHLHSVILWATYYYTLLLLTVFYFVTV